ncbi:putative methyltransferase-domain-containing protein [Russula dissimulans]|nr:putative methyltransferase-domain-containing protein [Russula dissimulans]
MAQLLNTISPTTSLPPLKSLSGCSPSQVVDALADLRTLYFPSPLVESLRLQKNTKPHTRLVHDNSAPDSGYASAEEDDDFDAPFDGDDDGNEALELLRADELERAFAIKWLIGFTARSDLWASSVPETEIEACTCAVDKAASLLALFAGSEPEQAITRNFSFLSAGGQPVEVDLNDAPLLSEDHTSVGLQSWASSILLAERLCANPGKFNLDVDTTTTTTTDGAGLRVLELGAGTGLLSITAARILAGNGQVRASPPFIVATDFHPDVLENLQRNVDANGNTQSIVVRDLDWSRPNLGSAPFDRPFDLILAADVVYEPSHAFWIANCVMKLLAHPAGVLWMIIALRSGGRHEGLSSTVGEAFSREEDGARLAILEAETLQRIGGHGRADEMGYQLFKIGWVHG